MLASHAALRFLLPVLMVAGAVPAAAGQAPPDSAAADTLVYALRALEVTATRTSRPIFSTPRPALVVNGSVLSERTPNTVTELFRELPGLDVTGVGVQQPRPIIRGQRGQRVLLLSDGLRLNNTRRQQDFGEVPALIDPASVERVEIVRGPASVLYGSDAIGGVINVVTSAGHEPEGVRGSVGYGYGTASAQHRGTGSLRGRIGAFDFRASGTVRTADGYDAPAGAFGDIRLTGETPVLNTGVEDASLDLGVGVTLGEGTRLFGRVERYSADDAGFGLVEPEAYAVEQPRIEITYPTQRFTRFVAGVGSQGLALPVADRIDVTGYLQDNERRLAFDFFQGFGPQAPEGAGISIATRNFTDIRTGGFRLEAKKLAGPVLVTYGADLFRDDSDNTDSTRTVVTGFGPPQEEIDTTPQVPEATYRSFGLFVQGEGSAGPLTLIGGIRFQDISASAAPMAGLTPEAADRSDNTVVGAINAVLSLTDRVNLVASVGRAFRSPNLIEWFFEGPVPEASAFQVRNPDLVAETSLNVDVGIRYQGRRVALEGFAFRNKIDNGIRTEPTGDQVGNFTVFQNVNVDELRFQGVELAGAVALGRGINLSSSWTHLTSEDVLRPDNPVGESFSDKLTGSIRYDAPGGRMWAGYYVRHNGEQKEVNLGTNPLGDVLPAFTVHALRGGVRLFGGRRIEQHLTVSVENLTDDLYAETSNASFFRPEPGRSLRIGWRAEF